MLDLKLNAEHANNIHGYRMALEDLEKVLDDPDTIDGVICMDKNHRLMFDIDYLNDKILEYMEANYRGYYKILGDMEVENEN